MKGSLRKRGERSWEIRLYLGRDPKTGEELRQSISFKGPKKAAEAELARLVNQIETGAFLPPAKLTVSEFLDRWREYIKTRVGTRTFERYASLIEHWIRPELGALPLAKLQPLHVQQLYNRALEGPRRDGRPGGLAPQSVLHIHRVLSEALKMAVRWQLAARNVCDAVEPPSVRQAEIQAIDESQTVFLLDAARGTRLYIPILLAVSCGLRRGEILALRWTDVDWVQGLLWVRRSVEQTRAGAAIKEPKSPRSRRSVALATVALEALKEHRAQQDELRAALGSDWQEMDLICPRNDGSLWPPQAFTSAYRALLARRGLTGPNFHALRHSHASQLIRAGLDIKVVSTRLGHAKSGFTLETYGHLLPGQDQEAAQRIDRALRSAMAAFETKQ
ncbi:MAG TPA: site-specific integrase [Bryobacteraceae bacterium]|nr:site-specific integrase [Bryobacteraceae bacterium]